MSYHLLYTLSYNLETQTERQTDLKLIAKRQTNQASDEHCPVYRAAIAAKKEGQKL